MSTLTRYEDFLERVDELGFMTLSRVVPGLPSLSEETPRHIWHTGDADTDPWRWKDRAAQEKRLAYGCILGGHKGFVARRMYPLFYAAYHPAKAMCERWAAGQVNQTLWRLWQLFEEQTALNTSSVRRLMNVRKKSGASRVDVALVRLQRDYYITVAGNERKVGRDGQPYGWAICLYCRVMDWAPAAWIKGMAKWQPEQAQQAIVERAMAMSNAVRREDLVQKLDLRLLAQEAEDLAAI
jgi:hypothetical protein